MSSFSKSNDDPVTCPMMNIMTRTRTRKRGKQSVYRNHDASRQCTNRCMSSKNANLRRAINMIGA